MLHKLGLTISYFVAVVYILSILWPALYCLEHGCRGPELDAFMPAFALTPVGAIGTAFALHNTIQNIRKKSPSSWVFWPLAIVFAIVLVAVAGLIVLMVYFTVFHGLRR